VCGYDNHRTALNHLHRLVKNGTLRLIETGIPAPGGSGKANVYAFDLTTLPSG